MNNEENGQALQHNWNFQFGPEEKSKAAVETSPLIEAIKKSWSRNAR
jgi:hypothetical protein